MPLSFLAITYKQGTNMYFRANGALHRFGLWLRLAGAASVGLFESIGHRVVKG